MDIVIIAEKPSAAKDIAAAILDPCYAKGNYMEGTDASGKRVAVTWLAGHTYSLADAKEYGAQYEVWSFDTIPIYPAGWNFIQKPISDKVKLISEARDVVRLLSTAGELVNACDAGREGELIFRKFQQVNVPKGVRISRMWAQSTTKSGLTEAYVKREPSTTRDSLGEAAYTRDQADWMVGINMTILSTLCLARTIKMYTVGRVQTPTLAMIVDRQEAIDKFIVYPFWEVYADFPTGTGKADLRNYFSSPARPTLLGVTPSGTDEKAVFWEKPKSESFQKDAADPLYTAKDTAKMVKENPPKGMSLTTAQRYANTHFGWSSAHTLRILQSLYEAKLVTYPRTDSSYFPEDYKETLYAALEQSTLILKGAPDAKPFDTQALPSKKVAFSSSVFNSKEVRDHYALAPTEDTSGLTSINADQKLAYVMIVRSCLMALDESAVYHVIERIWNGDGKTPYTPFTFRASQRKLVALGWKRWFATTPVAEEEKVVFPTLTGKPEKPTTVYLKEGKTSPPKPFTEASLLGAMETAGKAIRDTTLLDSDPANPTADELQSAMGEKGIGTPSTRASIIETLTARTFIEKIKRGKTEELRPTDAGCSLIVQLRNYAPLLTSPIQTADWEYDLLNMEQREPGAKNRIQFLDDLLHYIKECKAKFPAPTRGSGPGTAMSVFCPKSKEPMLDHDKYYSAPGFKKLFLWKQIASRTVTADEYAQILMAHLSGTEAPVLSGFLTKEKKPFSARLVIDGGKISFKFEERRTGSTTAWICPISGQPIQESDKAYTSPAFPDVAFWKTISERPITGNDVVLILTGIKSNTPFYMDGFQSKKTGNKFRAAFEIKDKKLAFLFEPRASSAASGTPQTAKCPKTSQVLEDMGKFYKAAGWPTVALWKTVGGRDMSAEDYEKMLVGVLANQPTIFSGFISKEKKTEFSAGLTLEDTKLKFVFSNNGGSNAGGAAPAGNVTGKPTTVSRY